MPEEVARQHALNSVLPSPSKTGLFFNKEQMTDETPLNRTCGTCRECCVQFDVVQLNKPAGVPCRHLRDGLPNGCCGFYDGRPRDCRTFTCSWLDGFVPDEMKPNLTGIVLQTNWIARPNGSRVWLLVGEATDQEMAPIAKPFQDWILTEPQDLVVMLTPRQAGTAQQTVFWGRADNVKLCQEFLGAARQQGLEVRVGGNPIFSQTKKP